MTSLETLVLSLAGERPFPGRTSWANETGAALVARTTPRFIPRLAVEYRLAMHGRRVSIVITSRPVTSSSAISLPRKRPFDHRSEAIAKHWWSIPFEMPWNKSAGALHIQLPLAARCNQAQSGGLPFVAVMQIAHFRSDHDAAGRLDGAFHRSILAEREVRARPLVVRDVGPKDSTKMPLI